jgi:hypothetical protein
MLLAVAALAGCGGDDDDSEKPTKLPDLTVPQSDRPETTTSPTETETVPETEPEPTPTTPPSTGGGNPAPETTPQQQPDAPENDTAPPADSPAERFEEFCNENPGACG